LRNAVARFARHVAGPANADFVRHTHRHTALNGHRHHFRRRVRDPEVDAVRHRLADRVRNLATDDVGLNRADRGRNALDAFLGLQRASRARNGACHGRRDHADYRVRNALDERFRHGADDSVRNLNDLRLAYHAGRRIGDVPRAAGAFDKDHAAAIATTSPATATVSGSIRGGVGRRHIAAHRASHHRVRDLHPHDFRVHARHRDRNLLANRLANPARALDRDLPGDRDCHFPAARVRHLLDVAAANVRRARHLLANRVIVDDLPRGAAIRFAFDVNRQQAVTSV
jgi:hypothetical protein